MPTLPNFLPYYSNVLKKIRDLRCEPWLTEGAIHFLTQFLSESPKDVLEFGSGASTLWLSSRAGTLVSIEHNPDFYEKLLPMLPNTDYRLCPRPHNVVCKTFHDAAFDFILVDGCDRNKIMKEAPRLLRPGGVLMLDNAERYWYTKVFPLFATWNQTISIQNQKDSHGFHLIGWQTRWWIKPN